jgi:hypothetical protein
MTDRRFYLLMALAAAMLFGIMSTPLTAVTVKDATSQLIKHATGNKTAPGVTLVAEHG